MKVKKGVITAAARGARLYPVADTVQKAMLPFVDIDGLTKPVIQIIAEEALAAGIEEICIVCAPGDEERYHHAFLSLRENLIRGYEGIDWAEAEAAKISALLACLHFAVQEKEKGYGHAVLCAEEFVGEEPFLLLLGDHFYKCHHHSRRCSEQLIATTDFSRGASVTAVNATSGHLISHYGTLAGKPTGQPGLHQVERVVEKPSLSFAEVELMTPGLRQGHFLCVFGMHILQPEIFRILRNQMENLPSGEELQLTSALQALAEKNLLLACEVDGTRFDLSDSYGLFQAQLAFGLAGGDRDEMINTVVQILGEAARRS
ncbi:MAG: sugar phosphate nucleotidyltransferase [Bacteroidia bacterium]|nr:sugar phosphate nucleotidyltransferase [Bacteroidia bacterium]